MLLNEYELKARILPVIAGVLLPVIFLNHYFLAGHFENMLGYAWVGKFLGELSLPAACLFPFSQITRVIGKSVFEKKYFQDEFMMPTTNLLLYKNLQYPDDYKIKINSKINKDFDLTLFSKKQEEKNEQEARRKVVVAMSFIRKKMEKNELVYKHNIEYGFIRNGIGASAIGALISIINLVVFYFFVESKVALWSSLFLFLFYFIILLSSKFLIESFGYSYAKMLIREYMTEQ